MSGDLSSEYYYLGLLLGFDETPSRRRVERHTHNSDPEGGLSKTKTEKTSLENNSVSFHAEVIIRRVSQDIG